MADRKVLNKYFPPDFDPTKLWKNKRFLKEQTNRQRGPKAPKQMQMRMMFPFTLCCSACNEFVYVGTKFNSRVEKVVGEDYLGVEIWRFYGRCPNCRNEIAFKTDPKNGDYTLEFGGVRTYDAAKDSEKAESILKEQEESYLEGDRMKQMEAKTYNTQQESQALEDLDEIRHINKRFLDRDASVNAALQYIQSHPPDTTSILIKEDEQEIEEFKTQLIVGTGSEDENDRNDIPIKIKQQNIFIQKKEKKLPKLIIKRKQINCEKEKINSLFDEYASNDDDDDEAEKS